MATVYNTANSQFTSYLVSEQVPDFVRNDYPVFVKFIEKYYEFLAQSNTGILTTDGDSYYYGSEYALKSLPNIHDIDTTDLDTFISSFRKEYAVSLPDILESVANRRTLYKNLSNFYRAKGTEDSFKYLFRLLYNEEIDLYYPKGDMLIASGGEYVKRNTIRVATCDDISHYVGMKVTGANSGATAVVEEVVVMPKALLSFVSGGGPVSNVISRGNSAHTLLDPDRLWEAQVPYSFLSVRADTANKRFHIYEALYANSSISNTIILPIKTDTIFKDNFSSLSANALISFDDGTSNHRPSGAVPWPNIDNKLLKGYHSFDEPASEYYLGQHAIKEAYPKSLGTSPNVYFTNTYFSSDPFSLAFYHKYQPGDNIMPPGFSSFDQPEDLYHFAGSVGDAGAGHVSIGNTRPYPVTSIHNSVQVSKEIYTGGGANSYIGTTSFNINTYKIYGWVTPSATSAIHNSKLTFANSHNQNGMHLPENEEDFSSHIKIPKGKKWILSCWVKSHYSNTTADNRPDPNSVGTNLDTGANTRFFVYGSNTSTNRGQIYEGLPDHVVTPANGEWARMVKVIDLRSSGVGNIGNSTYSETALGYANGPSTGHSGGVDDSGPSASPLNQWERMVIAIGVDFHVFSNTAYFFDGFQLEESVNGRTTPSDYKAPRTDNIWDAKYPLAIIGTDLYDESEQGNHPYAHGNVSIVSGESKFGTKSLKMRAPEFTNSTSTNPDVGNVAHYNVGFGTNYLGQGDYYGWEWDDDPGVVRIEPGKRWIFSFWAKTDSPSGMLEEFFGSGAGQTYNNPYVMRIALRNSKKPHSNTPYFIHTYAPVFSANNTWERFYQILDFSRHGPIDGTSFVDNPLPSHTYTLDMGGSNDPALAAMNYNPITPVIRMTSPPLPQRGCGALGTEFGGYASIYYASRQKPYPEDHVYQTLWTDEIDQLSITFGPHWHFTMPLEADPSHWSAPGNTVWYDGFQFEEVPPGTIFPSKFQETLLDRPDRSVTGKWYSGAGYNNDGPVRVVANVVSAQGGTVLRIGNNTTESTTGQLNDERALFLSTSAPYNPNKLYKMSVRARDLGGNAASSVDNGSRFFSGVTTHYANTQVFDAASIPSYGDPGTGGNIDSMHHMVSYGNSMDDHFFDYSAWFMGEADYDINAPNQHSKIRGNGGRIDINSSSTKYLSIQNALDGNAKLPYGTKLIKPYVWANHQEDYVAGSLGTSPPGVAFSQGIVDIDNIILEEYDSMVTEQGYYSDESSLLSTRGAYLQDNWYRQVYAYDIRTSQQLKDYKSIIKDAVHPAGMTMFGTKLTTSSSIKPTGNSDVIINLSSGAT